MIEPGKNGHRSGSVARGALRGRSLREKRASACEMDTPAYYRDGRPALADALEANGEGIPER